MELMIFADCHYGGVITTQNPTLFSTNEKRNEVYVSFKPLKINNMSDLRKVIFTLEEQCDLSYGELMDATKKEQEKAEKRKGFFHAWGNECFFSEEELVSRIVGIVEEESSGKVYQVIPKRITFVK